MGTRPFFYGELSRPGDDYYDDEPDDSPDGDDDGDEDDDA